jgi:predicted aldo/keto reductase-like oxidoreductase
MKPQPTPRERLFAAGPAPDADAMPRVAALGHHCPPVLRLGLATRGDTHLDEKDIEYAVARGVNYLNWCGHDDGLAEAVRSERFDRDQVVIAFQLSGRTRPAARRELADALRTLNTTRIDVVTFYYVEEQCEGEEITGPDGALEAMEEAQILGQIRMTGLTTHQRALGTNWTESGKLDLLMIRYNAAHRGAEQDVFPVTDRRRIPVVAFTAQRWGALRERTPEDPWGFSPPPATAWYRFALANPAVSIVLMAPGNRRELEEDLTLLDDWRPPHPDELESLIAHGRRVRKHARLFP